MLGVSRQGDCSDNSPIEISQPGQVSNEQYQGLNGFHDRCCVYGSAIAVLTEQKFPDSNNNPVNEQPESDQLRRE
ncbi:hypothetical protein DLR11_19260 [Salmonella enterica subsp. salamae]|uniref:Uncharacterized protein n=1 Tax=Salmonella enterica subsp. salamae TaxID=59202 RepID=A0A5Y3V220_SALER|nr:hypothetical protein [Salmonella enterica subsp. salamae]EEO8346275.1 hypothetical protein [Salmonella enterica]ECI3453926.1 hypothetical protein [Salmonella enterica subsp. salamae]ECJ2327781.1 hypothetical protein [Salmonella enterica subsp. salamae]EDV0905624.1 hypothetical protein [Salmonella enterica subsp. salamae]